MTSDGVGKTTGKELQIALLAMWSFHIAPSGDVHLTIPEVATPLLRQYAPDTCVVLASDDIQHRRFSVEMGLSVESSARLAERELAAYAAADGVFFVSREDRPWHAHACRLSKARVLR